eukprot:TRINITY_DN57095_c0_g1_i1.p1 TRINITY_DN57095_c0_g1~~TRINITY_DN57095_c0_g1_i1.p1  ORF type:complete len:367 (-),score=47.97 TRINITY_DN57095_c0_g1_i1:318-1319(-)
MVAFMYICLTIVLASHLGWEATGASLRGRGLGRDEPESLQDLDSSNFGSLDFVNGYVSAMKASGISVDEDVDTPQRNATAEALLPRRTLVVAKFDEDDEWLQRLPKNIDVVVYQSKDTNSPHYVENFGNEASKYLSYIVDNYDALPDSLAFVQAGRQDWHDPLPKDHMLKKWDWGRAAQQGGIASLPTAAPCLIEVQEEQPLPSDAPMQLQGYSDCQAVKEHVPKQMPSIREAWSTVFESQLGPLPQRWLTHCCAQFEVTREAILQHPLAFYQDLLSWSLEQDKALAAGSRMDTMKRNHDLERRDAGHILEPIWVLLFSSTRQAESALDTEHA